MKQASLPFRMAQCRHTSLVAFDDSYFLFLREMGCGALYLQNAPFDPMRTGNRGQFFRNFHHISLFDISRSHRREDYQQYINEVCRRAARHGIEVWFDCWEPRLPAYAQSLLPVDWRGRGGWGWHGNKEIAFCWEMPEAVAYWKAMARDAIAALPGLAGVIVSMIDNEASFCDETCPRCKGRSLNLGISDVYSTFMEMAAQREGGLKLAMYDWWLPPALTDSLMERLPTGSLVIGRSARGIRWSAPDGSYSGDVSDISNVADGLSDDFKLHCTKARNRGHVPIDMVSWSRGTENFWLPAPPDPLFAIRKCKALSDAGAEGWMDYDCGCIEPGSLSGAMREWTAAPGDDEENLLRRTLEGIWGEAADEARSAYGFYRNARAWMPFGIQSRDVVNMDARCCGFGFCLFGPYHLDDLRFSDTDHAWNYFAPYNLLAGDTIPVVLHATTEIVMELKKAWQAAASLQAKTPAAQWEVAVFEIYWCSFRAIRNYASLAHAKWEHGHGNLTDAAFRVAVAEIASDELENLDATELWHNAHEGVLGNPCGRLVGHMMESWPDADFGTGIFIPKRKSLVFLRDQFDPANLIPSHVIQCIASDACPI